MSNAQSSLKSTQMFFRSPIPSAFIYVILFLFIIVSHSTTFSNQHIRHRRFPFFGSDNEKAGNYCANGGKLMSNGKCECKFPYTGLHCTEFNCDHGLSTGSRYDPDSIFFNKKCICEENWSGELCHIPIANQCKERGQYINGRCVCHGFYFGPKCQYVGKCVKGKLQEGLCHCEYGYEGDYCDQIVCHHGYPDKANDSKSCVCPDRHTGFFCDECLNQDPHILPFPNCTLQIRPSKAKMSREKTDQLIMKRILVIFIVLSILVILLIMISAHKWSRTRAEKSDSEIQHKESNAERQRMLLKQTVFRQNSRRDSLISMSNHVDQEVSFVL